jgi:hypothetical protein
MLCSPELNSEKRSAKTLQLQNVLAHAAESGNSWRSATGSAFRALGRRRWIHTNTRLGKFAEEFLELRTRHLRVVGQAEHVDGRVQQVSQRLAGFENKRAAKLRKQPVCVAQAIDAHSRRTVGSANPSLEHQMAFGAAARFAGARFLAGFEPFFSSSSSFAKRRCSGLSPLKLSSSVSAFSKASGELPLP